MQSKRVKQILGFDGVCMGQQTGLFSAQLTHLAQCRIYASVSRVSIGSDNGLSPIRHQAII